MLERPSLRLLLSVLRMSKVALVLRTLDLHKV